MIQAWNIALSLLTAGLLWQHDVFATELRVKSFVSQAWLERHDIQSRLHDDAPLTGDVELRFMTDTQRGAWSLTWHHTATWQAGDDLAFARALGLNRGGDGLRGANTGDAHQLLDLSDTTDDGDRHQFDHRVERLNATWRGEVWSVTAGREALSLGGGILFHPMDFLSPFAPTTVDKDFKAGEDLVHVHRQMQGGEVSLLVVGRRDNEREITRDAASIAAKGRWQLGMTEFEGLVADHHDEFTTAIGVRLPIGGALLRTDVVVTRTLGELEVSAVANLDFSTTLADKLVYTFVEYYHNGFGIRKLSPGRPLPTTLERRLARGEVYTLMRDYLGVGGTIQWHPLVTQSLSLVRNLDDDSMFLQGGRQFDISDHQNFEAGLLVMMGDAGDEFGGKPLAIDQEGELITAGTGTRVYLRWTWFPRFAEINRN